MTLLAAAPPPDGRVNPPNGIGAPPVSARAAPAFTSGPVVGFRAADFSTGLSTRFGGTFGVTFAAGSGATISGAFGAGGAIGAGFESEAASSCTGRPEIWFKPPASGPVPALLSVIIIGGTSADLDRAPQ